MICPCGALNSIEQDDCNMICTKCGMVQETSSLVQDDDCKYKANVHFSESEPKSRSYKVFHHLYYSYALMVKIPKPALDEGFSVLESLWRSITLRATTFKKRCILALIYILFRKHRVHVTYKQLLKSCHESWHDLTIYINLVRRVCQLELTNIENYSDIIHSSVQEYSKIVLKDYDRQVQKDAEYYAQKLASVILEKDWISLRKSYHVKVSVTASIIAAQYILNKIGDPIIRETKHLKCRAINKIGFTHSDEICKKSCITNREIQKLVKLISENLLSLSNELPWKPSNIKYWYDVFVILDDILQFNDVHIEETSDSLKVQSITDQERNNIRMVLLNVLQIYIARVDKKSDLRFKKIDCKDFIKSMKDCIGKENIFFESKGCSSQIQVKPSSFTVFLDNDTIIINGIGFSIHYIELIKDLLISGCPVSEIKSSNYVELVANYIDLSSTEAEEEIRGLDEEEMESYIKCNGNHNTLNDM